MIWFQNEANNLYSGSVRCPESLSHSRPYHYHDHPQHVRSPAVQRCGLREEIRDTLQPSWGYDEAYAQLGIMRQEAGDIEGAREAFVKALEVNPNNGKLC